MNDDTFAGDFGFFKLSPTLTEFKVQAHQQSKVIAWFWQNAKTWTASTQSDFDYLARIKLAAKLGIPITTPDPDFDLEKSKLCKHWGGDRECPTCLRKDAVAGWAMEQLKQVNESLKVGAEFRVPAHLRHRKFLGYSVTGREIYSETQLVDDAVQTGWVKLLEQGVPDVGDKQANVVGQTAGHDVVKEARKYVAIIPTKESEDGEMVSVAPWDVIDPSDRYRRNSELEKVFGVAHSESKVRVFRLFSQTNPEDYAFLMTYMTNRRKGCSTRQERNRAGAIVKKLRRRIKAAEK